MVAQFFKISISTIFCVLIMQAVISCGYVDSGGKGVNDPPAVTTGDDQVVDEQAFVELNSSVVDDFGSNLIYRWEQLSGPKVELQGADAENATFQAPVVTVPNSPLVLSFQLNVTDNFGATGSGTVNVTVRAVNAPPVANDDVATTAEDTPTVVNVIDNDNDDGDVDGAVNPQGIDVVSSPSNGTATPNADGTVTYAPGPNFFGSDSFQYTVADNETVSSNAATVTVTVIPVNDPPVAKQGSLTTLEDQSATGTLSAADVDSALSFSIVKNGTKGTATITDSVTGTFIYKPKSNLTGNDTFTFSASDGEFDASAEVLITITPVNDAPRFSSKPVTSATVGEPYAYNVSVTDPDIGDTLTITAPTLPRWLTLQAMGDGKAKLSGVPGVGDLGKHQVKLQVTDNGNPSRTTLQMFTINVLSANDPPEFTSSPVRSATVGVAYAYDIVATDPDTGDTLTITAPVKPAWLSLTPVGNGRARLSGTPAVGDAGSVNVELRVTDNGTPAKSATQKYSIEVSAANNPPSFTSSPVRSATVGAAYTYDIVATDPDTGDVLTITAPVKPAWLTLTSTGNGRARLSGTPTAGSVGSANVELQVTDDGIPAKSAGQTFSINVTGVNNPPVFNSQPVTSAQVGVAYAYDVVATDPDTGNVLTITAPVKPAWLTLTSTGNGRARLSGTPTAGDVGSANVALQVTDDGIPAKSVAQSFSINVTGVNNPPVFNSQPVSSAQVGVAYSYDIVVTDPDTGNVLTITAPVKPAWLTLVTTGSGTARISGTPAVSDVGSASVSLQASDNGTPTQSVTQNFTIQVTENDNAKDLSTARSLARENTACWSTLADRTLVASLANDRFPSMASYAIVTNGAKGNVTISDSTTGQFEYAPDPLSARGVDSFDFRVTAPEQAAEIHTAKVVFIPRIMLLGDSITAGVTDGANDQPPIGQRTGYRKPLYDALVAGGYQFDFVGSQLTGANVTDFDADNEAHPEWSADEIAYGRRLDGSEGIYAWLEKYPADIILLHIGTHQLNSNPVGVQAILDELERWERSPNGHPVTVLVARIIDQNPLNPDVSSFNTNLGALIQARTHDPSHADDLLIVDQHAALNYPADLYDEIHPKQNGYAKMAKVWFDTLSNPQTGLLFKCL